MAGIPKVKITFDADLDELKKVKGIGKVMFDIIKNILPEAMRTTATILD